MDEIRNADPSSTIFGLNNTYELKKKKKKKKKNVWGEKRCSVTLVAVCWCTLLHGPYCMSAAATASALVPRSSIAWSDELQSTSCSVW